MSPVPQAGDQPRILLIDDEPANVALATRALATAGYTQLKGVTDPREVEPLLPAWNPDVVLLDLHMPHLDGFEVLRRIRAWSNEEFLPVLVLTADTTTEARRRALDLGATDFLTKPIDLIEVTLRVRNMVEARRLHVLLRDHNALLEQRVAERTEQLERSQREIAERLALAAEFRDDVTGKHTYRVGVLAERISAVLGLPPREQEVIRIASPLHDVGKIGIPDDILLKPGKLTPQEWEVIQAHVSIGARLLSGATSPILQMAEEVALTHHERWDGTGYLGIAGEEIPYAARIVSVADVYDALTHTRPYKEPWPRERAIEEITDLRGRHFDPAVVDAFLEVIDREPG